jgi:hypothetical protein
LQVSPISTESILEQLGKILASALFENAGRSRALLKFVVEAAVNNQADRLKEYTLGAEALGRGDSFDPRTDPIVRAEASRLRSRLERYYAAVGQADPIIIALQRQLCAAVSGSSHRGRNSHSLHSEKGRSGTLPRQAVPLARSRSGVACLRSRNRHLGLASFRAS